MMMTKLSSEMMLQDFDVTKKTLNVTFKKMLQKKSFTYHVIKFLTFLDLPNPFRDQT